MVTAALDVFHLLSAKHPYAPAGACVASSSDLIPTDSLESAPCSTFGQMETLKKTLNFLHL